MTFGEGGASAVEKRRVMTNTTDRLMLVFTEPEAQDYWLRPGESLEVRAEVELAEDDFELDDDNEEGEQGSPTDLSWANFVAARKELETGGDAA